MKYLKLLLKTALLSLLLIEVSFADSIDNILKEGETILEKLVTWVRYFIRIACGLAFTWNLYNYGKNNAPWESSFRWAMVILAIAASSEFVSYLFSVFDQ